jgi:hypothetical protein
VKLLVPVLALILSVPAAAQPDRRRGDARPPRHMKDDERQRMRDDVRDAYRERQGRSERPRYMSPEEREKLRRDIEEANRSMRRK